MSLLHDNRQKEVELGYRILDEKTCPTNTKTKRSSYALCSTSRQIGLTQISEKGRKDHVYAALMQLFRGINDEWDILSTSLLTYK